MTFLPPQCFFVNSFLFSLHMLCFQNWCFQFDLFLQQPSIPHWLVVDCCIAGISLAHVFYSFDDDKNGEYLVSHSFPSALDNHLKPGSCWLDGNNEYCPTMYMSIGAVLGHFQTLINSIHKCLYTFLKIKNQLIHFITWKYDVKNYHPAEEGVVLLKEK